MRGESLEVPGERPRKREEADGDDARREREDRRLLGRTRDEVAGRGHERDPEADCERTEGDRQCDAAARDLAEH